MNKTIPSENLSKESRLEDFVNRFGLIATIGAAVKVGAFHNAKGSALETWAKGRNDCRTLLWLIEHGGDLFGSLVVLGGTWGLLMIIHAGTKSRPNWIPQLCAALLTPGYILFFAADIGFISALSFFSKTN